MDSEDGLQIYIFKYVLHRQGDGATGPSPPAYALQQADISAYFAQSAQRIPVVVISTLILLPVMTFDFVQQELAAQDCCRAPQGPHRHITAAALQKSA